MKKIKIKVKFFYIKNIVKEKINITFSNLSNFENKIEEKDKKFWIEINEIRNDLYNIIQQSNFFIKKFSQSFSYINGRK